MKHITLPIHPRTGLTALGILPSGKIVWPAMGGDGTGDGGDGQGGNANGGQGPGGDGGQGGGGNQNAGGGGERTFSQSELEAIIGDRLARERSKYADYADVKAKAEELDKLREAEKTDLEKLQGQYEELLGKHSKAEHELRITRAASKHGLSAEAAAFLSGETDEEVEAAAEKLAALTNPTGGAGGGTNNGDGNNGGNAGGRRPDPSQGQGSSGDGASSMAAGRQRFRERHGKTNN